MRSITRRAVAAAALATVLAGCNGDAATAPVAQTAPAAPQQSLLGGVVGLVGGVVGGVVNLLASTVTILTKPVVLPTLHRTQPLARTVVASQVIGPAGGVFVLPGTGLTVTVAPGAVTVPTTFSATAYAGYAVAYDFAPHQKFAAPVVLTQSFAGTNGAALLKSGSAFSGAYFAKTTDVDWAGATGTTSELLSTRVDPQGSSVSMGVLHFSGYMVATGRSAQ